MKETIATILYNKGFKFSWVLRNAKLFYQKGKEVSWEQLDHKDKDYPIYRIMQNSMFPKMYYRYK